MKVKDQQGRIYQIEIQLTSPKHLISRMIYTACQLHTGQGVEGDSYGLIKPSIAIWLLTNDIPILDENGDVYQFKSGDSHLKFQFADINNKVVLGNDIEIHMFTLNRWVKPKTVKGFDNWLYFFTHAHRWKALPNELSSSILVEAMKVLEQFSEQEESYHAYISRQQARMKERSMELELEESQVELDQFKAELDQSKAELDQSKAENDTLLRRIAELEAKSK